MGIIKPSPVRMGNRGQCDHCVCVCRLELMDYLDSIDCSLEDFTAMFYGKHFSIDPDPLEVI